MSHGIRRALIAGAVGVLTLALPLAASAQGEGLLEEPEQAAMTDTLQYALEHNPTNESSDWVNPDTGRAGGVVPVRTFEGSQGQPCREFITTITIGGREEQGYGTACRQADGDWQIVSDDLQAPPGPGSDAPREVHVYPPPAQYYGYPPGFYGPYRIFLSFAFVHRSGHRHPGHFYLDGREFRHRYPLAIRERRFVGPRVYTHYPWQGRWDHRGGDGHRDRNRSRNDRWDDGGRRGREDRDDGDDRWGRGGRGGHGRSWDD